MTSQRQAGIRSNRCSGSVASIGKAEVAWDEYCYAILMLVNCLMLVGMPGWEHLAQPHLGRRSLVLALPAADQCHLGLHVFP